MWAFIFKISRVFRFELNVYYEYTGSELWGSPWVTVDEDLQNF